MVNSETKVYPHPYVTVDIVVFTLQDYTLRILLVKRKNDPFRGQWALPGGFVDTNEALSDAARRELQEETGVVLPYMAQLHAFGQPGRDPRGHTISIGYIGLLPTSDASRAVAGDDATSISWWEAAHPPVLAFDHDEIIRCARSMITIQVSHHPQLALYLLDDPFTLSEAQNTYEALLGRNTDRRNFRRRLLAGGWVHEVGRQRLHAPGRPARMYRVNKHTLPRSLDDNC